MTHLYDWLEDHPRVCIALTSAFVAMLCIAFAEGTLSTWRQM